MWPVLKRHDGAKSCAASFAALVQVAHLGEHRIVVVPVMVVRFLYVWLFFVRRMDGVSGRILGGMEDEGSCATYAVHFGVGNGER